MLSECRRDSEMLLLLFLREWTGKGQQQRAIAKGVRVRAGKDQDFKPVLMNERTSELVLQAHRQKKDWSTAVFTRCGDRPRAGVP